MRCLLLALVVVFGACDGGSEPPYESGLSEKLGFVQIGKSQAVDFCSVETDGTTFRGGVDFLTPTGAKQVREALVRAGGTVGSTAQNRVVITLGGDTYTVVDAKPTSVEVRFRERNKRASCPKDD